MFLLLANSYAPKYILVDEKEKKAKSKMGSRNETNEKCGKGTYTK